MSGAGRIRDTGTCAGIWVAPFIPGAQSRLPGGHPDWLVGEAGHNWDQDLLGVDLTHPGARDYVWSLFRRLRELGVNYVKLDFMYGGALPGDRYEEVSGVTASRRPGVPVRARVCVTRSGLTSRALVSNQYLCWWLVATLPSWTIRTLTRSVYFTS